VLKKLIRNSRLCGLVERENSALLREIREQTGARRVGRWI
jgi:hypothetical protein